VLRAAPSSCLGAAQVLAAPAPSSGLGAALVLAFYFLSLKIKINKILT
jgi:hypothetical protein